MLGSCRTDASSWWPRTRSCRCTSTSNRTPARTTSSASPSRSPRRSTRCTPAACCTGTWTSTRWSATPALLTGVGFGVFQGGTTQEWTGGRDPGRRVDQGLLGRLLLALAGEGAEWSGIRAVLERCISVDDALPFPSVAVLARALRGACVSDPMAETRHVPGPPPALAARARESIPSTVGPVPRPRAPRRGRDGPGVPRRARRPRGGAQAASPRAPAFAPPARPVLPRGAGGEPDPPPAHRRGDRGRRGARSRGARAGLLRDGAARGQDARGALPRACAGRRADGGDRTSRSARRSRRRTPPASSTAT